jgi:hypothetical protein
MPITGYISFGYPIGPKATTDSYYVTDPQYGLGGLRTVGTTAERDAITVERRQVGMMVYVEDVDAYYSLLGGTSNSDWTEFTSGGKGSQGPTGTTGPTGSTGPTGPQLVIIDTVSTTIDETILKGSTPYSLSGDSFVLTYAGGISPATGCAFLTDPTKGTGFPVYFSTASMTGIDFTTQTLTAGVGDSVTIRIVVTGAGTYSSDSYDYEVFFGNEIRWGGSNHDNLSGTGIQQELDNSIGSNSLSHVFTESLTSGNYLFVAYPTRLGEAKIAINNAAYGGTKLQGYGGIPGNSIVNSTNVNGYLEPFYVYRSEHPLGLSLEVKIAEQ